MSEDLFEDDSLIENFIIESEEHLDSIEKNIVALEQNPDDDELLNSVFRSFHTIKGNSKWLNFESIASLTHEAESLLGDLRSKKNTLNSNMIDIILDVKDTIQHLIDQVKKGVEFNTDITDLVSKIKKERNCR